MPPTNNRNIVENTLANKAEISRAFASLSRESHPAVADLNNVETLLDCEGLVIGLRAGLDAAYAATLEKDGIHIDNVVRGAHGLIVAAEILVRRDEIATAPDTAALGSLNSLGSLDDFDAPTTAPKARGEVVEPAEVIIPDAVGMDDALRDEVERIVAGAVERIRGDVYGDEDDEAGPPADLIALGDTEDAEAFAAALEALVPSLADNFGTYEVGAVVVEDGIAQALLTGTGIAVCSLFGLAPGMVVFQNAVPGHAGFTVSLAIAGEIDPENPPPSIHEFVNEAIAVAEAEGVVIEQPELALRLVRLDGQAFTDAQLAEPLRIALGNLTTQLGAVRAGIPEAGENPSERLVPIVNAAGGRLDPRAFTTAMAAFDGTMPFADSGRVRATLLAR